MRKTNIVLEPEQEQNDAVEIFRKYEYTIIPVVNQQRKLIGIVTADDVFDVAEEEATEDIQQFGGHAALEDSYFATPILTMLRKRAGWLAFLFISGFISGEAIRSYEDTLAQWGFLMFFLPIITSAGGNSGTQAASLVIRSLAIKELALKDASKVLLRELVMGVSLGTILATIGYFLALSWGLGTQVGVIVAASLVTVVIFGVISGSMLPFILAVSS